MTEWFYAFVYDLISCEDLEKWLYSFGDMPIEDDIYLQLLECDYRCDKEVKRIKFLLGERFRKEFDDMKQSDFYNNIEDDLREMIIKYENENRLTGELVFDCAALHSAYMIQTRIRQVFKFPPWYGHNWDAFNDLVDLSDVSRIVLKNFADMENNAPSEAEAFIRILKKAAYPGCEIIIER